MKKQYDVIIVGCGVAGCFAALQLPKEKEILMIAKSELEESDSYLAQGGICVQKDEQDYDSFYQSEIRMRQLRRYPPFADLFTFTISGTEEGTVLRAAAGVRETLRRICALPEQTKHQAEVLGPAPAPVLKVNNRYRYRVLLVGKNDKATRDQVSWLLKEFANDRAHRGLNIFVDCNTLE